MEKKLLSILCCPVTHKGLALARGDLLASVNRAIEARELVSRDGAKVKEKFKEALVTDDGKILYPVDDGIPVLIEGAGVTLDQLAD